MAVKNEFDTEVGETVQYNTNYSTLGSDGLDDTSKVRGIEETGTAVLGTKSHTTTPSVSGTPRASKVAHHTLPSNMVRQSKYCGTAATSGVACCERS